MKFSYQTLFLTLFFFLVISPCSISISNTLSITETITLEKKQTLVSPKNVFELGFTEIKSNWYLGLWLMVDTTRTVLWVANRDTPITGGNGTLKIVDNNLVLVDQYGFPVWRTNLTGEGLRSPVMAELLDTGNFVLKYSSDPQGYLWESFDSSTDTLLPEMKLEIGTDKILSSWSGLDDQSWPLTLGIEDYRGSLGIFVWDAMFRFDVWNGDRFGDMPPVLQPKGDKGEFVMMKHEGNHTRLKLRTDAVYEIFTWNPQDREWNLTWSSNDSCFRSKTCGSFSYCSVNTSPPCHCINGFSPKLESEWAGCFRKTALSCTGDGFTKLQHMNSPEIEGLVYYSSSIDVQECKEICLADCNCTAFAVVESTNGQRSCVRWSGELDNMRNYTVGGHDLYVKLFAPQNEEKSAGLKTWIIGLILGGVILFICFCFWKRIKRGAATQGGPTETEMMINRLAGQDRFEFMDLRTIVEATDNFSQYNELGRGGFGIVYKGILSDGREVAVKRLSNMSSQGIEEFKNEVATILNVLHKNLVRLLGCCCEGDEKILIYEYLEHSSLNRFLFHETRSRLLNWEKRFRIIGDVCQDTNMTSKISDFGMAKILQIGQTKAETQRLCGTHGYMAEEYPMCNTLSEKSDVFSFGVMILEIITGRKNYEFCNSNPGDSLLGLVWRQWQEGTWLNLVDSHFEDDTLIEDEVLRCLQIALCCVQDDPELRPSTEYILVMLKSRTMDIPQPKEPHYYYAAFLGGQQASSSSSLAHQIGSTVVTESNEVNEITVSIIQPR